MTVPEVDSGTLRVFVVTNADNAAMEHNASANNNRLMSTTTATMSPCYVNENDLAVLRQLYTDFGGDSWSGTKWKTGAEAGLSLTDEEPSKTEDKEPESGKKDKTKERSDEGKANKDDGGIPDDILDMFGDSNEDD